MKRIALALVVLGGTLLTGDAMAAAQDVTFSVAVSMKDAVEELGRGFMAARPGVRLRYNLGASGDLQKQIEAGAPIDLFISAAQRHMDELERKGLVVGASRRTFAGNVLTVITPADSRVEIARPEDLLRAGVSRIVIGNPKTVPVGHYAEESLRALGLWDRLRAKLIFSENVRQALDYVARGEVDAGFVYATDTRIAGPRVKEAFRPAAGTYQRVLYPVAVVAGSRHPSLAQAFVDLLLSREGRAVLERHGFQPPPSGVR